MASVRPTIADTESKETRHCSSSSSAPLTATSQALAPPPPEDEDMVLSDLAPLPSDDEGVSLTATSQALAAPPPPDDEDMVSSAPAEAVTPLPADDGVSGVTRRRRWAWWCLDGSDHTESVKGLTLALPGARTPTKKLDSASAPSPTSPGKRPPAGSPPWSTTEGCGQAKWHQIQT